jgi:hypothetical protein
MKTPSDILERLKGVFQEKNKDYGNSWEKVSVIKRVMADRHGPDVVWIAGTDVYESRSSAPEHAVEAVVLADTPRNNSTFEQNVDDLITRLLDKLIRSYNLTLMKDEPALENESTLDAWEDLTGYSAMGTALVERHKDNE